MVMIIDVPVASYFPPEKIEEWIRQLERARHDPDAEPFDLQVIDEYLERARGWLQRKRDDAGAAESEGEVPGGAPAAAVVRKRRRG